MQGLLERVLRPTLIALVFWFTTGSIAHADLIGVASVIDADTIEIHGERIRLRHRCARDMALGYRLSSLAAATTSDTIACTSSSLVRWLTKQARKANRPPMVAFER
jgi:hypothetical protein